ncbi:MAG: hypothetical protein ACD_42C00291G0002 [uncultured bacterium]|nr:MAG: hypothetical protein ACD_42C00291G0002 [uncultured bacterium]OGT32544.1 MAG: hypothetical protein A3C44_02230 [Gammaproteobacteria bacterium RIFCSPHIGHO2_02_FULL_39_13]OGT48353.1 MAG: hypothetical protein A3E53_05925 [Gammaproteobacteria bacterium RIFCSPHIGHO2_12_FULL_39_24]
MNIFRSEPTSIAEWRQLVIEGQENAGFRLVEPVENYVVITLNAHTSNLAIASSVLAMDFLNYVHVKSNQHFQLLRTVGDQCLILAGLFPDRAKRKNVSADYFKNVGENAYYVLSFSAAPHQLDRSLFYQLFENFAELIEVLKAMRKLPACAH